LKKKSKVNLVLFFNNQRGYNSFLYLKKKKYFNIKKIFLSKKFLDKNILTKLKKYSPSVIKDPNTKNVKKFIKNNKVDFSLICGFPYIFKDETINEPKFCTLNLHAGKLPNYRGGSPLNWQIINGEKKIGLSVVKIDSKIDQGPIVAETNFILKKNYDIAKVHSISNNLFPKLLYRSIKKILTHPKKIFYKQIKKNSKYYNQRTEKDGKINWKSNSTDIFNLVRATTEPYPCAFTFDSKRRKVKIIKSETYKIKNNNGNFPGKVSIIKKKTFVDCLYGKLHILKASRNLVDGEILY
jgi:methionyl-tRNA formyltransferase